MSPNEWAVLGVMGPQSRTLLSSLTRTNLDNESFPFGTGRELEITGITCWAQRITYVGELGWELYCPWNAALELFCVSVRRRQIGRNRSCRVPCT